MPLCMTTAASMALYQKAPGAYNGVMRNSDIIHTAIHRVGNARAVTVTRRTSKIIESIFNQHIHPDIQQALDTYLQVRIHTGARQTMVGNVTAHITLLRP